MARNPSNALFWMRYTLLSTLLILAVISAIFWVIFRAIFTFFIQAF